MNRNKFVRKNNVIFLSNAIAGIATFQGNLIEFFSQNKIKSILIDTNKECLENLHDQKLNKFYKCNLLKEFNKSIEILKEIERLNVRKNNIFIISNTAIYSIYFFLIKLIFKKSQIILFYHSHIYNFNFTQIIAGFVSSLLSIFNKYNIYVSNFTLRWWNVFFPLSKLSNQKVIYNLVKLPAKVRKKKHNILKIGFIGRFEREKGLHKFLEVAKNIENKKLKFYIFGKGSIKINKIKNKNLKLNTWTKKDKIYNKINLLFVTSKIENCPFSVLEAKSRGIPTITISKGGIKEIIKNNNDGIILNNNISIKEIEKNFVRILDNYKFYEKNCIENSKKFRLNNYERLSKLINV